MADMEYAKPYRKPLKVFYTSDDAVYLYKIDNDRALVGLNGKVPRYRTLFVTLGSVSQEFTMKFDDGSMDIPLYWFEEYEESEEK